MGLERRTRRGLGCMKHMGLGCRKHMGLAGKKSKGSLMQIHPQCPSARWACIPYGMWSHQTLRSIQPPRRVPSKPHYYRNALEACNYRTFEVLRRSLQLWLSSFSPSSCCSPSPSTSASSFRTSSSEPHRLPTDSLPR